MKSKSFILYILCTCFIVLGSCKDDDKQAIPAEPAPKGVEFLNDLLTFDSESGSQSMEIYASEKWTIHAEQPWCKITPASGEAGERVITITVDKNENTEERNSAIILKTAGYEKYTTVSQKQKDALLLSSNKVEISCNKQHVTAEVKATIPYKCIIDESAADWISVASSRGLTAHSHLFDIKENETEEPRQGKITFRGSSFNETFTIYQDGKEKTQFVLGPREYIIESHATDLKIELKSNTSYQMILPDVSWIHKNESRNLSSYTHIISIDENNTGTERSANLLFMYNDTTENISIVQKEKEAIVLAKNNYEMDHKGGQLHFMVASNVDFTVACNASWIQQTTNSRALSTKALSFTILPNQEEQKRTGEIILSHNDIEQKISISQGSQELGTFNQFNALKTFTQKGSSQQLTIYAAHDWQVTSMQEWCTVSPSSGKAGKHTLSVTVNENQTTDERNAGLLFKYGNEEKIITVTQKQKDALLLNSSKVEIGTDGGEISMEVTSNIQYKIHIEKESSTWITPLSSRAMNLHSHRFKVAPNTSTMTRCGTINIVGDNINEQFTVYQEGTEEAKIILSKEAYYIDKQEQQLTIELKSNTSYQMILPQVDWIHEDLSRALSTYTHHFTIDKNLTNKERSTEIQFHYNGHTETVMIHQDIIDLTDEYEVIFWTHCQQVTVPLLKGLKPVTGTTEFHQEELTVPYKPNVSHFIIPNFQIEPATYYLVIKVNNAEEIYFEDISDLTEIEL